MKSVRARAFYAVFLSVALASAAPAQTSPARVPPDAGVQPAAAEPAPQVLPETPASPPQVTCKGDQLSIAAKGSTLASILSAVRECTGAKIDIPASAGTSRFFDTLGPGPIRQVLSSLLDATDFNYVIGASDSNPEKVETIVLMARVNTPETESTTDRALNPNRRAFEQMRRNYLTAGVPDELNASTPATDSNPAAPSPDPTAQPANDSSESQPAPADQSVTQSPSDATPEPNRNVAPAPVESSQPAAQPSSSMDDQIKSMEQLFQERKQMIANQPH